MYRNAPPIADFSGDPLTGVGAANVQFTDLSVGAVSWFWEKAEMGVGYVPAESFSFEGEMSFGVRLTVTNAVGISVTRTKYPYVEITV
jgi:PKD repeat protein